MQPVKRWSTMIDDHRCGAHTDPTSVPESWPWVLVLQHRLQEIIHKHTLRWEGSGSSFPAIYFKNAKQGCVCNLCWHQRDATPPTIHSLLKVGYPTRQTKQRYSLFTVKRSRSEAEFLTLVWPVLSPLLRISASWHSKKTCFVWRFRPMLTLIPSVHAADEH